jgi:hypothetical protein
MDPFVALKSLCRRLLCRYDLIGLDATTHYDKDKTNEIFELKKTAGRLELPEYHSET